MKSALIVLTATLAAVPAVAQDAADEAPLVDALVVNARTPGPAWWSVSKGDAKVWLLGTYGVPASAAWDSSAFDRRVKATRHVIFAEAKGSSRLSKDAVRADRAWLDELNAEEKARLETIAGVTGRSVEFYTQYRPTFASLLIKGELEAKAKTKAGPPLDLKARAKALGARLTPVKGRLGPAMKASFGKGQRDDMVCVRWALKPRDSGAVQQAKASAWTRGDVRDLLIGPSVYDPCTQGMKAMQATLEQHEGALADEVAATLEKGRGAVGLVGLTPLLRQDGVLDQLRKRGYLVRTPAQLED